MEREAILQAWLEGTRLAKTRPTIEKMVVTKPLSDGALWQTTLYIVDEGFRFSVSGQGVTARQARDNACFAAEEKYQKAIKGRQVWE